MSVGGQGGMKQTGECMSVGGQGGMKQTGECMGGVKASAKAVLILSVKPGF